MRLDWRWQETSDSFSPESPKGFGLLIFCSLLWVEMKGYFDFHPSFFSVEQGILHG